jgi:hypothetical protein
MKDVSGGKMGTKEPPPKQCQVLGLVKVYKVRQQYAEWYLQLQHL